MDACLEAAKKLKLVLFPEATSVFIQSSVWELPRAAWKLTALLKELPAATGMTFVLVQPLDPKHESKLTDLLAKATGHWRDTRYPQPPQRRRDHDLHVDGAGKNPSPPTAA